MLSHTAGTRSEFFQDSKQSLGQLVKRLVRVRVVAQRHPCGSPQLAAFKGS
jgi:hypothetical protein